MKDLTKIYIDLSKCTEEEQKHIFSLLPEPVKKGDYFIDNENHILHFNTVFAYPRWYVDFEYYNKQELTYPEFIKLFEGGEDYPGKKYQPLFDHLNQEHGLILHESEMDEIIRIVGSLNSNQ